MAIPDENRGNEHGRTRQAADGRTVICVAALSGNRDFASGYGKSRFPSLLSLSGTWKHSLRLFRDLDVHGLRRMIPFAAVHKYAGLCRIPI